jgi:hypothetical protein
VPGIISGSNWLRERRRVLSDELKKDLSGEQRTALEAELAAVDQQMAAARPKWWQWLFMHGVRPPR